MSFDLFLQHFADGEPAATDRQPVLDVLARYTHSGPDAFGFYRVELPDDGGEIELGATGLDGSKPFGSCAFHLHGIGPRICTLVLAIAAAGRFVVFNPQAADGEPMALLPPGVALEDGGANLADMATAPIATPEQLLACLTPGAASWQALRDQVVFGAGQS